MTIIYHYCDASAFISIITDKKLWLTHTRKMNDHSEGLLIERALLNWVDEGIRLEHFTESDRTKIEEILRFNRPDLYACCFSTERDSTTQWLNYADRGRGFALGFDADALWVNKLQPANHSVWSGNTYVVPLRVSENLDERMSLTPVMYIDQTMLGSIMTRLTDEAESFVRGKKAEGIAAATMFYGAISKDIAFHHEQEWRLIYAPQIVPPPPNQPCRKPSVIGNVEPLKWRAGNYGVTPYFEFPFPPHAIKEVWIGPANPEHRDKAARHLLANLLNFNGIWGITPTESQSPYR